MKSGFITIAGKPNAGKSTLLNTLIGEKVAIVSWRPQTTRNKIIGVMHGDGYQAVFTDTPGIHYAQNQLGEYMMKSVRTAMSNIDGLLYVVNAEKDFDDNDRKFIEEAVEDKTTVIIAVNKIDCVVTETLFKVLEKLNSISGITAVIPISAKRGDGIDDLKQQIIKLLKEGEEYFPKDMVTDKSMRFIAAEMVREKALKLLDKEIPYGIGVNINKFQMRESGNLYDIDADIVCEKQSHKAIIIGKGGSMLKQIATEARIDIEEMCGEKVFLTLWVRVKENWRDDSNMLMELGYNKKDL